MEKLGPAEKADPEYVLRGKTLRVYLYFLKYKQARGISEIQHALGFSSPSIAVHHLEKLQRLGVVSKDEFGSYSLEKKIDVSILQGFTNIGSLILPRFAFYVGFFLILTVSDVIINLGYLDFLATVGLIVAVLVFFYESWRFWKNRPFQ